METTEGREQGMVVTGRGKRGRVLEIGRGKRTGYDGEMKKEKLVVY